MCSVLWVGWWGDGGVGGMMEKMEVGREGWRWGRMDGGGEGWMIEGWDPIE